MTDVTEQLPVEQMTVKQLKDEAATHAVATAGKNKAELVALVSDLRAEDDEPDEIEGEATEETVEPTPEEEAREHEQGPIADEVRQAESLALELRERAVAVGPQATMPGLAELNAMRALAEQLANSRIVPSSFYGKPDDIIAATLMGRELGIGPMQSLKDIAVIDGRPALAAHLQLALLRRGGLVIIDSSVDDDRAYIKARRSDSGETAEVEWTYAEAEKVTRKGKSLVDGDNWRNYRRDMLWARAVGRLTRRLGSDLVAGMTYTAEEVRDFEDDPYGYGTNETPTRVEDAPEPNVPRSLPETIERMKARLGDDEAVAWMGEATVEWAANQNATVSEFRELSPQLRGRLGKTFATIVLDLERRESETGDDLRMSTGVREKVAKLFAARLDGVALHGPPWRLGPDEESLPTHSEYVSAQDAAMAPEEDIDFPANGTTEGSGDAS